ncbi:DUF2207 domain-containing protein [Paucisalibacillus globulus]|uniref:DUF2207 domain-containing protein n=1 Tax=Paucisalibacillus globulus TaxID=351095 RepID=UPI00041991BE|nr:DUF2207 domain-containing protein [Paucisalibacillus globulus]
MKKLSISIVALLAYILFPIHALAVKYDIEKTDIHAYLGPDGNVQVEEIHTYAFEGDFNGITRTLIAKEGTQIQDVKATENGTALDVEQEDNLYKVYRSGADETVTIHLTYTIKDGVEVYSDMAQFYWPFFDQNNESDYSNLDIYIHPPKPTGDVEFIGYDSAWDSGQADNDGVVHFAMGHVSAGQQGDVRAAYDSALFSGAPSAGDTSIREDILADKEKKEAEIAAFQKDKDMFNRIAPFVIGGFVFYLLILMMGRNLYKRRIKSENERQFVDAFFVPKTGLSMPATIQYMNNGVLDTRALTAALLDLVRNGYVKEKDDEKFIVVNRQTDHMHEQMLIAWLFDMVGKNGTFRLSDLETYTKNQSNHESYRNNFMQWQQSVKQEVEAKGLYEKRNNRRIAVGFSSLIMLPFTILFGVYELYGWMIAAFILAISVIVIAISDKRKTAEGAYIKEQWERFEMKFADLTPTEWSEWLDDDQKRAFIYGLGRNNQAIQKKNKSLLEHAPQYEQLNHDSGANMLLFLMIASSAHMHFDQAEVAAAPDISTTSSSGTPRVGGGIGGGGGGSGAF